jgi:hypothetical protein
MNWQRVREIIAACCVQLRKGEAVKESVVHGFGVTEIFAMQHVSSSNLEIVDVHFFAVGVDLEKAAPLRDELRGLLLDWPPFEGGPSYLDTGAELGDQGLALTLYGLGEALCLWSVVTPERLGIMGSVGHELAGRGLVMCTGLKS